MPRQEDCEVEAIPSQCKDQELLEEQPEKRMTRQQSTPTGMNVKLYKFLNKLDPNSFTTTSDACISLVYMGYGEHIQELAELTEDPTLVEEFETETIVPAANAEDPDISVIREISVPVRVSISNVAAFVKYKHIMNNEHLSASEWEAITQQEYISFTIHYQLAGSLSDMIPTGTHFCDNSSSSSSQSWQLVNEDDEIITTNDCDWPSSSSESPSSQEEDVLPQENTDQQTTRLEEGRSRSRSSTTRDNTDDASVFMIDSGTIEDTTPPSPPRNQQDLSIPSGDYEIRMVPTDNEHNNSKQEQIYVLDHYGHSSTTPAATSPSPSTGNLTLQPRATMLPRRSSSISTLAHHGLPARGGRNKTVLAPLLARAKRQNRLVLVMIYNGRDRNSSGNTRSPNHVSPVLALLENPLFQCLVAENYLVWHCDDCHHNQEASRYAARYHVKKFPYMGVIHPYHKTSLWGIEGQSANPNQSSWRLEEVLRVLTTINFDYFSSNQLAMNEHPALLFPEERVHVSSLCCGNDEEDDNRAMDMEMQAAIMMDIRNDNVMHNGNTTTKNDGDGKTNLLVLATGGDDSSNVGNSLDTEEREEQAAEEKKARDTFRDVANGQSHIPKSEFEPLVTALGTTRSKQSSAASTPGGFSFGGAVPGGSDVPSKTVLKPLASSKPVAAISLKPEGSSPAFPPVSNKAAEPFCTTQAKPGGSSPAFPPMSSKAPTPFGATQAKPKSLPFGMAQRKIPHRKS